MVGVSPSLSFTWSPPTLAGAAAGAGRGAGAAPSASTMRCDMVASLAIVCSVELDVVRVVCFEPCKQDVVSLLNP